MYVLDRGIHVPPVAVEHRDDEYDSRGFALLERMQSAHFWYLGRHRFIAHAVKKLLARAGGAVSAIDLGGGCGGWLRYLWSQGIWNFDEVALADSSRQALERASNTLPGDVDRYQVDLLDLYWRDRWDMAFALDVIEHIPDDVRAVQQIAAALKPGGHLIVTTPALQFFWSWNDRVAGHQRRYNKADYARLASASGLELCEARYFMFFLSPLYMASRLTLSRPQGADQDPDSEWEQQERTHRVPPKAVNSILRVCFESETPLGHWLPFPWGTSILAIMRKPLP